MSPTRPVPDEQAQAFGRAVCERLGIDPAIVGDDLRWRVLGDEELSQVHLTAYLPAQELLDMFNAAGRRDAHEDRSREAQPMSATTVPVDPRPRCARCSEPVDLWAVQDQGASSCDACGLIVYEDGHMRELHNEP